MHLSAFAQIRNNFDIEIFVSHLNAESDNSKLCLIFDFHSSVGQKLFSGQLIGVLQDFEIVRKGFCPFSFLLFLLSFLSYEILYTVITLVL